MIFFCAKVAYFKQKSAINKGCLGLFWGGFCLFLYVRKTHVFKSKYKTFFLLKKLIKWKDFQYLLINDKIKYYWVVWLCCVLLFGGSWQNSCWKKMINKPENHKWQWCSQPWNLVVIIINNNIKVIGFIKDRYKVYLVCNINGNQPDNP